MMQQLGIRALRPGPGGNESAPNHANYDESTANPFPDYPDILKLKNGRAVTTAEMWWKQRRPEIVEDFQREVLGCVPRNAPKITWTVTRTVDDKAGPYPVVAKELIGRADNTAYPEINVEIQMVVVTPAWIRTPAPLMILFGRAALPSAPVPAAFARFAALAGPDPHATVQLIGAKDLGLTEDYRSAKMPPVNTGLLAGSLAWRQHDGGHTDGPNWKYVTPWASRSLGYTAPPPPSLPAHVAVPRTDANSLVAHAQLLERRRKAGSTSTSSAIRSHAAGARDRLSFVSRQLEEKLLRMECSEFRLGRGSNPEHPVAA